MASTLLVSFKLLAIVSPVPLWFTPCHYSFGIFKLLALVSPVPLWFTSSHSPFGIFKLLALVSPAPLWFTPSHYKGQKFEDTKRVIRRRKSERDRWYKGHKFEDTKRVIRSCKSERGRWYKGQKLERLKFQNGKSGIACPSLIYGFWILFWCLQILALVSPVSLWFTASDYHCGIFQLLSLVSLRSRKSERDRWYKG
jgi:hypothetical protein